MGFRQAHATLMLMPLRPSHDIISLSIYLHLADPKNQWPAWWAWKYPEITEIADLPWRPGDNHT